MVKLGFYVIKKDGKKGLREYEEVYLRLPKELHELVRCLRNQQLEIKASREGNITHIMLIEKPE
ncbi:MAG TPA: hypothetical protein VLH35_08050 [Candidatus Acidoferrales bacterium]|nr:hypothetical protein [Candidatus Acidoferrales bacterium]